MSAALRNPTLHERIKRASQQAPAQIAELEKETGVRAIFGPAATISQETVERMLGEELPEGRVVTITNNTDQPLKVQFKKRTKILKKKGDSVTWIDLPWWKRALNRILYYVGVSVFLVTPIPNMQLQKCTMKVEGQVMTIRCDSSQVCPEGYHLDTWWAYVPRQDGELIQTMFGYGPAVKNSCIKGRGDVIFPAKDTEVIP